jgi:hypothetical protein
MEFIPDPFIVRLSFLTRLSFSESKAVKIETLAVDSTTVLKAGIPANGGQTVRIVPVPAR